MQYSGKNIFSTETTFGLKILVALFCGIYSGAYIFLFEPFGFATTYASQKLFLLGGYVLISTVIISFAFIVFSFFNRFIESYLDRIIKYVAIILFTIATVGAAFWFFNLYNGLDQNYEQNLIMVIIDVLIMSILPVLLVVFLKERDMMTKHMKTAEVITTEIEHVKKIEETELPTIEIFSENQKNSLSLRIDHLLCIQGSDNYSTVYYRHEGKITREMLRVTLKNIETQLLDYNDLMRCHKSYIVNIRKIEKVRGNAQGYKLYVNQLDFQIPVSRNFPKSVLDKIKTIEKV